MLNLIKMDFRRLFKSKIFYIIMGVAVLMSVFMMMMFGVYSLALNNIDTGELSADTMALLQSTLPSSFTQYMEAFYLGNYIILFIIIFAVIFCNAEYSRGYIKNIAPLVTPRYLMVFSKLIITVFVSLLIYLLVGAVTVAGCAVSSVELTLTDTAGMVKMLLIGLLLNISLTSFVMMIFNLFRKATPALISGIVYISMGSVLYTLVNLLVKAAFRVEDFDCTEYTCLGNLLGHVTSTADNSTYIRSVVVALVVLAVSTAVSCLSVQKKDIK